MGVMNKKYLTNIWLILSAFGIMFAVLSWIQDSNIINPNILHGSNKGWIALVTGSLLYRYVAKEMG